jgi:hypothetical protein
VTISDKAASENGKFLNYPGLATNPTAKTWRGSTAKKGRERKIHWHREPASRARFYAKIDAWCTTFAQRPFAKLGLAHDVKNPTGKRK